MSILTPEPGPSAQVMADVQRHTQHICPLGCCICQLPFLDGAEELNEGVLCRVLCKMIVLQIGKAELLDSLSVIAHARFQLFFFARYQGDGHAPHPLSPIKTAGLLLFFHPFAGKGKNHEKKLKKHRKTSDFPLTNFFPASKIFDASIGSASPGYYCSPPLRATIT